MGYGCVGDGGGDGERRVGLPLDLAHRGGRDGHLGFAHAAGDLRLDDNCAALALDRLLYQLIAVRSAQDGCCRAVLDGRPRRGVACVRRRGVVRGCWRRTAAAVCAASGRVCRSQNLNRDCAVVYLVIGLENHIVLHSSNSRGFGILPDKDATCCIGRAAIQANVLQLLSRSARRCGICADGRRGLRDLHFNGCRGDAGVVHAVGHLVPDGVLSSVDAGGNGRRVNAVLARAVHHRADVVFCASGAHKVLWVSIIGQCLARRCGCQLCIHPVNRPCDAVGPVDDVPV